MSLKACPRTMARTLWLTLALMTLLMNVAGNGACGTESDDDDTAIGDDDATIGDDDTPIGDDDTPPKKGWIGFVLIHCDPQDILQQHDNFEPENFNYHSEDPFNSADMWRGLMDVVDLADLYGHKLTLQLSPPYVEYIAGAECDTTLDGGREYPVGSGTIRDTCRSLVFAWEAAGHELSIHHHGVHHDPLKFDGYTNLPIWDTSGKRPCLSNGDCTCEETGCFWCAPPESPLICTDYEDPATAVGYDPEWRGPAHGPGGMWELVENVLGEHTVTSLCMNHQDEVSDMPPDPDVIYTTQGGGLENDGTRFPLCVVHDPQAAYHVEPKYVWFYQHELISGPTQFEEVMSTVTGGPPATPGTVLGMVFHVSDFVESELAPEDAPASGVHRALLAFLADPNGDGDTSDRVRIDTLSNLMKAAGKTNAPSPCADTCFALDTTLDEASYTIPIPPPSECP